MGYRSHVLFAIDATEDTTMRLTYPSVVEVLAEADNVYIGTWSDTPKGQPGYYVYEWEHIKWYESWPAVEALQSWMSQAEDDAEDEAHFMFLRDGDDITDLEHLGSWEFDLWYGVGVGPELNLVPKDGEFNPQLSLPMEDFYE
jgi:hypothetical protein